MPDTIGEKGGPAALGPVPQNVQPFLDVLGEELTLRVLIELGGAELYIPATPRGRGRLEAIVGPELTAELARADWLPGRIPIANSWLVNVLHRTKGLPVSEIARILRTTDKTVRSHLKAGAGRDDGAQPSLF